MLGTKIKSVCFFLSYAHNNYSKCDDEANYKYTHTHIHIDVSSTRLHHSHLNLFNMQHKKKIHTTQRKNILVGTESFAVREALSSNDILELNLSFVAHIHRR